MHDISPSVFITQPQIKKAFDASPITDHYILKKSSKCLNTFPHFDFESPNSSCNKPTRHTTAHFSNNFEFAMEKQQNINSNCSQEICKSPSKNKIL